MMELENLFEQATRQKFRFPYRGMATTEDLWDLSVQELDTVFKALNAQARQTNEESLLNAKSAEDTVLEAKIALVRHIVAVKQAEAEARRNALARKEQKEKLLSLIAEKQDQELRAKSVEELQAMLDAL